MASRSFLTLSLLALQLLAQPSSAQRPTYRDCPEVSPQCPVIATTYGYYPNLAVNGFFLGLFSLCLLGSVSIGVLTRTWTYTIALGLGTLLETVGYAGRVMMHFNPWSMNGFRMQIVCLILGPSFIAAAIYLLLKHFVLYCGPRHSVLPPRLYPWIFIGCDFFSIALQAIGGGLAASGEENGVGLLNAGNNLILAGIAFQVLTMSACGVLVLVFIWRYRKGATAAGEPVPEKSRYELNKERGDVATWKVKLFGWTVVLAYVTVLIRCIYRLPEMAGGWGNPLMRIEVEFLLLDGMMIAIACIALTAFHPGFFFPPFAAFRATKEEVVVEGETDSSNGNAL